MSFDACSRRTIHGVDALSALGCRAVHSDGRANSDAGRTGDIDSVSNRGTTESTDGDADASAMNSSCATRLGLARI